MDSFGHNGMLPQLLAKSGLDYYVFMRPAPHEKGLPGDLFWWESDDGSRVLAFRISIQLPRLARVIEADFAPCEIKTFRVPRDENLPVIETNLLEWEEPEG